MTWRLLLVLNEATRVLSYELSSRVDSDRRRDDNLLACFFLVGEKLTPTYRWEQGRRPHRIDASVDKGHGSALPTSIKRRLTYRSTSFFFFFFSLLSRTPAISRCNTIRSASKGGQDGAVVLPPGLRGSRPHLRVRDDLQEPLCAAHERRPAQGRQVGQDCASSGACVCRK